MSQPVRDAAAVLVTTGPAHDLRVLLVQRSPTLRFFGGYWAFPGGAMEPGDRATGDLALASCAIRELLEETALGAEALGIELDAARALLLTIAGAATPPEEWVTRLRNVIDSGRFLLVCRITTPAHSPIRFATDFVQLHLDAPDTLELDQRELIAGGFVSPAAALAQWRRGELPIAPPTLLLLELLAAHGSPAYIEPAARLADSFEHGEFHPARFSPGVFTAPVPTPTLPPATTTNCYIVGVNDLYVVDPAAVDAEHQQKLIRKIASLMRAGAQLHGILLTQHHRDRVGAAGVLSRHFGVPVHAHERCFAQLTDSDCRRGRSLRDGDTIALGDAPDDSSGWHLQVLHTPGYARDHLCFIDSRYRAAIVGDMLSTVSTIIIDPPEGHMATYLHSLERLLEVPMTTLYPAHGPAHRDGHALIAQSLAHLHAREQKIVEALGVAPQSLDALLRRAYDDVAPAVDDAALRSLLAGLEKLEEEGRAKRQDLGWISNA